MKWTEVQGGQLNCAFQRFMGAFGDFADTVVTRLNGDDAFLNRVAVLCQNNGFEPSTSQQHAREIMGTNMFGVEEAIKHFGVNPKKRQLAYLAEVPFSEATLTLCKDTHVLVAVFPIVGVEIREKVRGKKLFYKQDWYDKQVFANDRGHLEWHLVRKTPVADSIYKIWSDQQTLLPSDEETPNFQVMAYTIIGHFLATGERLFENVYVRCVDIDSGGYRVALGRFSADGLGVCYDGDDDRHDDLGLSSARKQET